MAIFQRNRIWWAEYRSSNGRRLRQSLKVTDRTAAKMLYSELLKSEQLRRAGVLTNTSAGHADPADLLNEYERELERRGRAPSHVGAALHRARIMFTGVRRLAEMTPEKIRRVLEKITESPVASPKAIRKVARLCPKTANGYRMALNGFFRWLVREERWPRNPVESVTPVRVTDPTRERRALEPSELAAFLAKAPASRSLIYRLAATTGLRRGELTQLRRADLDLDRGVVVVRASAAKSKKRREVPLPKSTIAAFSTALKKGEPEDLVFPRGLPIMATMKRDLGRAEILFETTAGVVDFHALRSTYGTNLARAGVPLAQAQKMLGHSDPRLTANFYTRLNMQDGHAAAAKLDALCEGDKEQKSKQAG